MLDPDLHRAGEELQESKFAAEALDREQAISERAMQAIQASMEKEKELTSFYEENLGKVCIS